MPYDGERDQYYWDPFREETGASFKRDGSDYDPSVPRPKLSDAFRVLGRRFDPDTTMQVTVLGLFYQGETSVMGFTFPTKLSQIEFISTGAGLSGGAVTHGGGGYSLEEKMNSLMRLSHTPLRITGLYFRGLD